MIFIDSNGIIHQHNKFKIDKKDGFTNKLTTQNDKIPINIIKFKCSERYIR